MNAILFQNVEGVTIRCPECNQTLCCDYTLSQLTHPPTEPTGLFSSRPSTCINVLKKWKMPRIKLEEV